MRSGGQATVRDHRQRVVLLQAGSPDLVRVEALVAQHLVDPAHRRPCLGQHRQGRRGEHAVRVVVPFDP